MIKEASARLDASAFKFLDSFLGFIVIARTVWSLGFAFGCFLELLQRS